MRMIPLATCTALAFAAMTLAAPAQDKVIVGLITKTNTNPFFVKMKEGAEAKANELGVELRSYAGAYDGDVESQVAAIESLIAAGAKGILITPNDSAAVVPAVQKARNAGLLVIALDTQLVPSDAADATFATDNFKAGELIGAWAAKTVDPASAKIALLDLNQNQPTVDVQRDQGFMKGFGLEVGDETRIGDEENAAVVGHDVTSGNEEGGRKAMENLMQRDPGINLVYTINEPAAAGAYEALNSFGMAGSVTIVSVDGGCPGVQNVKEGIIGATSMQFPLKMAALGVEAVKTFADSGTKPANTEGLDFVNTGVTLITDKPVDGVESITSEEGLKLCWG